MSDADRIAELEARVAELEKTIAALPGILLKRNERTDRSEARMLAAIGRLSAKLGIDGAEATRPLQ